MISVEALSKRYGEQPALRGLDLTVPAGEIFGFVGPNGAGKTSTIRILATLSQPDAGRAEIAGVSVTEDPAGVRELIGYMPDFFGLYDQLTAREYLEFYAACHGVPPARRGRVAGELLELVELGERAGDPVDTLSRGMQQRLGLARALVHDPRVLLLDEPASGLDPRARVEMRELLRELRRMGKTVLISSHILPELEDLCTWVGFIDGGRMVASGPLEDIRGPLAGRVRVDLEGSEEGALTAALEAVRALPGVSEAAIVEDCLELVGAPGWPERRLLRELVEAGVPVRGFAPAAGTLADAFLRLTASGAAR